MESNYSLKDFNTFGFDVTARYFAEVKSLDELRQVIKDKTFKESKKLILSGGSNILFSEDYFDGYVIYSNIKGIEVRRCEAEDVTIFCWGGEAWKDFVDMTVNNGWYGLENLSDIPGKVGAAPIQNIGAYGAEVKDCIKRVYTIDIQTGKEHIFSNKECGFGYRQSIFKKDGYKQYLIYAVEFVLKKNGTLKLDYGNIRNYLINKNISNPSIKDVSQAVKSIRGEKLPEVGKVGSVGSFFRNSIIEQAQYQRLKTEFPDIPSYPEHGGKMKIPSGWLIEQCGWKGHIENHVGVWDKQALVLVHYGGGKALEIINLMKNIQDSIEKKFGIRIFPEVNIV